MSDHSEISSLDDCKMSVDAQNHQATLSLQSSYVAAEPYNRFELGFNQPMVSFLQKNSPFDVIVFQFFWTYIHYVY